MSDETKDKCTAETVAENMAGLAQAVAEASPKAEEAAATVETIAAAGSGKKTKAQATTKAKGDAKAKADTGGALKSVGLDACKRHGIAEVWVTADGQSFPQSGDAKAHAANLNDKQILNVKAE